MKGKKGIELSLNFLIVMIISVTILFGGIAFTYRFLGVVENREASINEEMSEQIKALLVDGHQTAIPIDLLTIKRGGNDVFGLGIFNSLPDGTEEFRVVVKFKRAYDLMEEEMGSDGKPAPVDSYLNQNWVFGKKDGVHEIETNQYELIPILVNVKGEMGPNINTRSGMYEFNVCVCPCRSADGCATGDDTFCLSRCSHEDSINQGVLYGGHIMKLYVEVPQ